MYESNILFITGMNLKENVFFFYSVASIFDSYIVTSQHNEGV